MFESGYLKESGVYARLHAWVGISTIYQRRPGDGLLWSDKGHEHDWDGHYVRPAAAGLDAVFNARQAG